MRPHSQPAATSFKARAGVLKGGGYLHPAGPTVPTGRLSSARAPLSQAGPRSDTWLNAWRLTAGPIPTVAQSLRTEMDWDTDQLRPAYETYQFKTPPSFSGFCVKCFEESVLPSPSNPKWSKFKPSFTHFFKSREKINTLYYYKIKLGGHITAGISARH